MCKETSKKNRWEIEITLIQKKGRQVYITEILRKINDIDEQNRENMRAIIIKDIVIVLLRGGNHQPAKNITFLLHFFDFDYLVCQNKNTTIIGVKNSG